MLDLCNHSLLSSRCLPNLIFIINQSSSTASHFLLSPLMTRCAFFFPFHSSNPSCHPIYTSMPVNMATEKGPKVTLWQANQALVFLPLLTPIRDFNMISKAICIPFVAIESYQSASFPLAMLTDCWKSARKRKEQRQKMSKSILKHSKNIQSLKCKFCRC